MIRTMMVMLGMMIMMMIITAVMPNEYRRCVIFDGYRRIYSTHRVQAVSIHEVPR